jgi:hypothetical protein
MPPRALNPSLSDLIRPDGIGKVWYEGREILQRIFVTVRDSHWAEIPPSQFESSIDESTGAAILRARHISTHVAFEWEATLIFSRDSRQLRFAMVGKAMREMELCRLGLVVLHPVDTMVGSRLVAASSDGNEQQLIVSEQIAPQPVVSGVPGAMTQPFSKLVIERDDLGRLSLLFRGDLFEIEDQRNWGDASFKTYCTPLRLGFPRPIEAGAVIEQSVEVSFDPAASSVGSFPRVATQGDREVEVAIEPDLTPTPEVLKSLVNLKCHTPRLVLYGENNAPPSDVSIRRWKEAVDIPIFAGTRGYFVEFNRKRVLSGSAAGIAFPLTSTVHGNDSDTIIDNVPTIVSIAATARKVTGYDRIVISPLSLYHPPGVRPSRFPKHLVRAWLIAMLIQSAAARIESVVLSTDILEAIEFDDPKTRTFISALLNVAGVPVISVETCQSTRLHIATFGPSRHQMLAANLSQQPATLMSPMDTRIEIPAFGSAWIDGETVIHF